MKNNSYTAADNIHIIQKIIDKKAIRLLRRYNKKYIKELNAGNEKINIETTNLLKQANHTIKNTTKTLRIGEIVDSATLMRSSMEKIMMAMMIYFDPSDTYAEFKNLKKCGKGEHTRPSKLIDNFKLKLKDISPILFEEFKEEELKKLLEETYEKLCLYTHSSIAVSMMIEVENNNDEDLFIAFFYLINNFLELLLYCCLKYLSKDNKNHIDLICLLVAWSLPFNKIEKNKLDEVYIEKYKKYLYLDINAKANDKYKDIIEQIKRDNIVLKEELNKNPNVLEEYILKLIKE